MKKTLITLALLVSATLMYAQEETQEETPKDGWSDSGTISLLFNQSAFNAEWQGGGTSNIAGNLSLSYDINYRKGDVTWDNKVLADYGLTKLKGQEFTRKTNDRLELNSIVGKQIKESNWFYSFFLNFRTQFDSGYEYFEEDVLENGVVVGTQEARLETTHFLSPGYLQAGPGLLWKKSDNFKVNFAPATARLIFVDDAFTSTPGYVDGDYFGVDANESTRFEFGAAVNGYAKFNLVKNVSMENILNLYANYLEDPQNVDIDYTANIAMTINKFMSANITFQAIYDDNAVKGFQIREVFGLGINYGF
ncbi:DUF3078 domain-containing protein [Aquimarina intermedia]|uniref:DUF3078 family protein n=1 Tax=Aquimarina intermedia TaxID=350814 RepID=A0A5S5CC85_9FLAO|nr:DUF3078 domain-containing protein [Aquimarina intermedia]TYP76957.1 Protein of unknown function (DUF3078) [Aquimarina intermedia]